MQRIHRGIGVGLTMALAAITAGCGAEEDGPVATADRLAASESAYEDAVHETEPLVPSPEVWMELEERITAHVDSVNRALFGVPNLTGREVGALRSDANASQVALAQRMGIRAGDGYERLAEQGRLVRLPDSTRYWIVRELDFSVPYVTPDTEAMLAEMGRRFHAQLDSLGLPRFRMEITSVLRTPENQRALRRVNANAASGASAHEFATTVDVAYRRFAPPAQPELLGASHGTGLEMPARLLYETQMVQIAADRGTELQAVLGRVIHEMRREGKLQVMMENRQTVYHMTVAKRYPNPEPVPAE
jgi:hypothetical protein